MLQNKCFAVLVIFVYFMQFAKGSPEDFLNDGETFDFIVVGGGTAGCVIAGRLAESGEHSVLLIEEGGVPNPNLEVPGLSSVPSLGNFPNELKIYQSVPQQNAGLSRNGTINYLIGKTMGGGSSVNAMFWNRGHPEDYNNWARLTKDPSWSYENMLKFFKKSENYSGVYPTKERGYGGPITLTHPSYYAPAVDNFIEASQEIGYSLGDPNGPQTPSIARIDFSMDEQGLRVSSFKGYIKPLLNSKGKRSDGGRSNLLILINTEAKRITFKGNKATGVTFVSSNHVRHAKARKEIIISAGTLDSPKLLQRSGIGPKEVLQRAGIPIVKELPVGKNLHDHLLLQFPVIFGNRSMIMLPSRDLTLDAWRVFKETGGGPYSSYFGMKAQGIFVSSLESTWPDIQIVPQGYENSVYAPEVKDAQEWEIITGFGINVLRPKSRGTVNLNPKNPDGPPIIDFRYLSHPDDMKIMKDAIKLAVQICERTEAMKRIGCRISSTPLPACGHFKFRSDSYWTCYIKQQSSSGLHSAGTCRMGGVEDPDAVVDSQLKVIGVEGLRVADASVMPQVTNLNTQVPVYAIAEKAADLILKKWDTHKHNLFFASPFNVKLLDFN